MRYGNYRVSAHNQAQVVYAPHMRGAREQWRAVEAGL
jgi:hypothetical protein